MYGKIKVTTETNILLAQILSELRVTNGKEPVNFVSSHEITIPGFYEEQQSVVLPKPETTDDETPSKVETSDLSGREPFENAEGVLIYPMMEGSDIPRCTALTGAGTQCKNAALPDSIFCRTHSKK